MARRTFRDGALRATLPAHQRRELRPCASAVRALRRLASLPVPDEATCRLIIGRQGFGPQPEPAFQPATRQATVGQRRGERTSLLACMGAIGVLAGPGEYLDVLECLL